MHVQNQIPILAKSIKIYIDEGWLLIIGYNVAMLGMFRSPAI